MANFRNIGSSFSIRLLILTSLSACDGKKMPEAPVLASLPVVNHMDMDSKSPSIVAEEARTNLAASAEFLKEIYQPIFQPYCQTCHEGTFASSSPEEAYNAFLERMKIDSFNGLKSNTFIVKMRQGHNCWLELRKQCVEAVQGSIETWLENIKKAGIHTTQRRFGVQTKAVAMLNSELVERIDYPAGDYIPLPLEKP